MLKCDKCKKEIKNLDSLDIIEWKTGGIRCGGLNLYHKKCTHERIFAYTPYPLKYNNLNIKKEIIFRLIFVLLILLPVFLMVFYGFFNAESFELYVSEPMIFYLLCACGYCLFFVAYLIPGRDIVKLLKLKNNEKLLKNN